jgi:surfeit locus 1 family protein
MMRRILVPLVFGVVGFAILMSLGFWQLRRLEWKEGLIAEIEGRIDAPAVALPQVPDREADRFLPVRTKGRTTGDEVYVVTSTPETGPGFRLLSAFETDGGRRILVDEGFIRTSEAEIERPATSMTVTGNLQWPAETDGFTPDAEEATGIWYARNVDGIAAALGTEPVLVVARTVTGADARATPLPVTTTGISNDHLGYAVQWFGLALVWAGMTAFLLWRIHRRTD